ncbi:MAG TPA: sigma-70 family RNA polymerase sigma factor [Solirubrobacteraceae bacterium]|nr:sigma-70 family RNA polymerase sigma factor [Solirubrobacteraceae bacterium]
MIVCVVPRDLERKLANRLFGALEDTDVQVVVDRRAGEDRRTRDRRRSVGRTRRILERRRVLALDGRRVADRRTPAVPVEPPALARRVRRIADRVAFVAPLEPPAALLEDVHAARAVIRAQLGEARAIEELYLTWFDRAYAFAQVSLGEAGAATDAVQDAFAGALGRLRELDPTHTAFRAFLFADLLEHVRARTQWEPPAAEPVRAGEGDPAALRWVNDRELIMLIRRLPAAEREALLLRYVGGLRKPEAAALLDVDESALTEAGLGRLRARLAELGSRVESSQREAMRRLAPPSTVLRGRKHALLAG